MMESLSEQYCTGTFLERLNRFVMRIRLDDRGEVHAYCPNTSRLIGLLDGEPRILLTRNRDPDRKTDFTIKAIRENNHWVGIEAVRANDLFESFLEGGDHPYFQNWSDWTREVSYEESQLDFRASRNDDRLWVEVKSLSSRSSDGSSFYSGTPSKRGYRHLNHLGDLAESGEEACCVFVVQRGDIDSVSPADVTEPDWLEALRKAENRGVDILGFRCQFNGEKWSIDEEIPTYL